jgi:hypothetical protein
MSMIAKYYWIGFAVTPMFAVCIAPSNQTVRSISGKPMESTMKNRQPPPSDHRHAPISGPAPTAAPSTTQAANWVAIQSGLWMRAGFVGASVFATGLVSLLANGAQATGETAALAAMVIGGAIAWFSWRNVAVLLRRIDVLEAAAAAAPAAAGRAGAVGIAAACNAAALAAR